LTSALRRCRQPVPARVAVTDGRPVRVTTDRREFAGGAVLRCAGPWRTSGEWWLDSQQSAVVSHQSRGEAGSRQAAAIDHQSAISHEPSAMSHQSSAISHEPSAMSHQPSAIPSAPWDRDEWDVALGDGAVYRIFQERARGAWFIDAIVD
jgi:hypothetical protein